MILAAHQPNCVPWPAYFAKMHQSDVFVIMIHCNFEKNGFQNRFNHKDRWYTLPIESGTQLIKDKKYVNGNKLVDVNIPLILGFSKMLGIDTNKIHYDFHTTKNGTDRIIELCERFKCDKYLTNPDATKKYLDEDRLNAFDIEMVPFYFPYKQSLFEMIETNGIDGTSKLIKKSYEKIRTSKKTD